MGEMLTIKETAKRHPGISEYFLRLGIKSGRIPCIRTGGTRGKYLIDTALLEKCLEDEAMNNVSNNLPCTSGTVVNFGQLRQVKQ